MQDIYDLDNTGRVFTFLHMFQFDFYSSYTVLKGCMEL